MDGRRSNRKRKRRWGYGEAKDLHEGAAAVLGNWSDGPGRIACSWPGFRTLLLLRARSLRTEIP